MRRGLQVSQVSLKKVITPHKVPTDNMIAQGALTTLRVKNQVAFLVRQVDSVEMVSLIPKIALLAITALLMIV